MQKKIESDRVDARGKLLARVGIDSPCPHSRDECGGGESRYRSHEKWPVGYLRPSLDGRPCRYRLGACRQPPDSWRDRSFSTWTGEALIAALGELDEGVRISTERRNGYAAISNPLIAALVERSLGYLASKRDFATDGMNTEEVLWRLSTNPRVGPDVLAVALGRADADNTYQTPEPIKTWRARMGSLLPGSRSRSPYRVFWRLR